MRIHQALALIRDRRPDLEIDGEMQPEMALDPERRQQAYGFSRLTKPANTLVFGSLASGNAAYQIACAIGGASAVGPILLGLAKPVAAMQNDATVEEIVNMTHVVLKAQRMGKGKPIATRRPPTRSRSASPRSARSTDRDRKQA